MPDPEPDDIENTHQSTTFSPSASTDPTPNPTSTPRPPPDPHPDANTNTNTNTTINADPNANANTPLIPLQTQRYIRITLYSTLLTSLLPAHIYCIWTLSLGALLRGYCLAFVVFLYTLAACILLLGVMVPPIMLVTWVWEVWYEVGGGPGVG